MVATLRPVLPPVPWSHFVHAGRRRARMSERAMYNAQHLPVRHAFCARPAEVGARGAAEKAGGVLGKDVSP